MRTNDRGMHDPLPIHKKIYLYTRIVLLSLFLFYTSSYIDLYYVYTLNPTVNSFLSWNNIREIFQTDNNASLGYIQIYVCLGVILLGTLGALLSRKSLHFMSTEEIMYSLNDKKAYVASGIFTYIKHPMYVSIVMITLGTYGMFPTIFGSVFLMVAYIFILEKVRIEE